MAGNTARILALAFCLGVLIGGSLPELGNLVVYYALKITRGHQSHRFNRYFLMAGLSGIAVCGFALYRRLL